MLDGNDFQIVNQLIGVAVAWLVALLGSLVILKVVDVTVGLRVSEDQEIQGSGSRSARRRGIQHVAEHRDAYENYGENL